MTQREPLKPPGSVGRTSGQSFQGWCDCSVGVGRGTSCTLPVLASSPGSASEDWSPGAGLGLLLQHRLPPCKPCSFRGYRQSRLFLPMPGTGCRMHTEMAACQPDQPSLGPVTQGSLLQEAAGDSHCHLQLFGHTDLYHSPLLLSAICILHVPSLVLTASTKPILITFVRNNVSRSELGTYLWEEHSRQGGGWECKGPRKEWGTESTSISFCLWLIHLSSVKALGLKGSGEGL